MTLKKWRQGVLLLALGLGCEASTPEVEIRTFVGESYARKDPELLRERTLQVLTIAVDEYLGATKVAKPSGPMVSKTVHPPRTKAEYDDLITALRRGPLDELEGPARRLAQAEVALWPQIREDLLRTRKAPKGDYRSLLAAIGGDLPNKYGYFKLAWRKAHGYNVKLSHDWFEDLLVLPRSKVSPALLKVYRDCIVQTALMRAASGIGSHTEYANSSVQTLLDVAYIHQGTFRDEATRAVVAIGDEAVPHLIVAAVPPSTRKRDRDKPEVKRARFAAHNLDKMDRLHPARATDAVRTTPGLLGLTLTAFGTAKVGEAAAVLLRYVDDGSPGVRQSARQAFLEYVTGQAPRVASRKVRLIGGGTGTALAYLTFRERARVAIRDRISEQAPDLLEPECTVMREDGKGVDKTCERQPARLAAAYFAWLDTERERTQNARIDAALASGDPELASGQLNRLLAENPELAGRDRLADFFASRGEAFLIAGEPAKAAATLRKAAMLWRVQDPKRAQRLHAQALKVEASLPGLPAAGREMLTARALELDPSFEPPKLEPASPDVVGKAVDRLRVAGGMGLVCVVLLAFGLAGSPLRRRLGL